MLLEVRGGIGGVIEGVVVAVVGVVEVVGLGVVEKGSRVVEAVGGGRASGDEAGGAKTSGAGEGSRTIGGVHRQDDRHWICKGSRSTPICNCPLYSALSIVTAAAIAARVALSILRFFLPLYYSK